MVQKYKGVPLKTTLDNTWKCPTVLEINKLESRFLLSHLTNLCNKFKPPCLNDQEIQL